MNHIKKHDTIKQATTTLLAGGVIAYPTEAVYGLGCDPFNEQAVRKLLFLKKRSPDKGLILIAHSWQAVSHLVLPLPRKLLDRVLKTWPGPITWVFPACIAIVPKWLRGRHSSIAIRITAHKLAHTLCKEFGKPIVSTSANIEGKQPARTEEEVRKQFPTGIDYILTGTTDLLTKPTPIYGVLNNNIIRQ